MLFVFRRHHGISSSIPFDFKFYLDRIFSHLLKKKHLTNIFLSILLYNVTLGAYDDPNGSHISITVVSSMFEGKRPVQRQQLVYKALWEELKGPVHAVDAMICKTPDEK